MLPAFKPGDHVLTFNWGRVDVGDVIVFKPFLSLRGVKRRSNLLTVSDRLLLRHLPDRNDKEKFYIKRVDKISGDLLYTSADNKNQSTRVYKVKKEQIVGKVILKY